MKSSDVLGVGKYAYYSCPPQKRFKKDFIFLSGSKETFSLRLFP